MKPAFNRRKATSFGLLFSFLIMLASGVILWIFPRLSSFSGAAEFGGLARPAWLNQHIVFGLLFALLSLYHLFGVNRELLFSYLKKSGSEKGARRPELLLTALATLLIAMITALHLPQVSGSMTSGREMASVVDQNVDEGGAAYEQRAEVSEHAHHHHVDDEYDGRDASSQISDSRDGAGTSADARFSAESRNPGAPSSSGAPDDELHRRTTRSCASCH